MVNYKLKKNYLDMSFFKNLRYNEESRFTIDEEEKYKVTEINTGKYFMSGCPMQYLEIADSVEEINNW
jgi:hypothetical protein